VKTYKTKAEIADALSVSVPTVDRLMRRGLPYIKFGSTVRFDPDAVASWIESRQQATAVPAEA
jgi:excisionase family DNA binding protein